MKAADGGSEVFERSDLQKERKNIPIVSGLVVREFSALNEKNEKIAIITTFVKGCLLPDLKRLERFGPTRDPI